MSMFSLGADEDDLDFTPSNGGGLRGLFGNSPAGGGSDSLKFSAPKQPQPESKTESPATSGVLFATVCQTYVYQNNNYAPKGKLGVAVTGSKSVIIYGQKQRVVSNCKLFPDTLFTITAANFLTYYDDTRQCWGVMLSSENDLETLLQTITVVKFSLGSRLLKQQANFVEDKRKVVRTTDNVTVAYSGYLIDNDKVGPQFDTNELFVVKLSAPTVIKGWVESLPGCVAGGVYLVTVPAALGYGDRGIPNRIPPNSDLLFKITVKQITPNAPKSPAASMNNDITDSSSVDSLPTPKMSATNGVQKNEILSRMARMGAHPALPITVGIAGSSYTGRVPSSPEPDEAESRSRASSVKSNRSKRKSRSSSSLVVEDKPPQVPVKPGPLVPHFTGTGFPSVFPGFPAVGQHVVTVPELKENLDISKNMGKSVSVIEASLKEVQAKLNVLSQQAVLFNNTVSSCPTVDTQLLMYNLQRIIAENESLKMDFKNKTVTLEERSAKITELLNKNQELLNLKNEALEMSQNSFLANSTNASKEIQRLEHENEQLKNELKVFKSSSNNRQFEIDAKQDQVNSLRSQIETLYTENNKLQRNLFETRNELSTLRMISSNSGGQEEILQKEINKLKERMQACLVEKLEISQQLDDQHFNEKQISLKFEKKIRQLQTLLEESQSSDANENCVLENRRLGDNLTEISQKLSHEKTKNASLEKRLEEEKGRSAKLLTEERDKFSITEDEFRETIAALNIEIDQINVSLSDRDDQIKCLTQELQDRSNHQAEAPRNVEQTKEIINNKVKQILNIVFRQFRQKVDTETTYEGSEVLILIMNVLKKATLSLMRDSSDDESSSAEESSDDDEPGDEPGDEPDDGPDEDGDEHSSSETNAHIPTTNSTEFEIPEARADFLHEEPHASTAANESFYSVLDHTPGREEGESSTKSPGPPPEPAPQDNTAPAINSQPELAPQDSAAPATSSQPEPAPQDNTARATNSRPEPVPQDNAAPATNSRPEFNTEEFEVREEEDLWMAAPPSEPPPSPAPATFEPNLQHTTVSVEDITHLSPEVFGAHPEAMTTSPGNTRRDNNNPRRDGPPPLFSDSEDDLLDI